MNEREVARGADGFAAWEACVADEIAAQLVTAEETDDALLKILVRAARPADAAGSAGATPAPDARGFPTRLRQRIFDAELALRRAMYARDSYAINVERNQLDSLLRIAAEHSVDLPEATENLRKAT